MFLPLIFRFRKRSAIVLILALLLGSTLMSMRLISLSQSALSHRIGEEFTLEARVRTDPLPTSRRVIGRNFAEPSSSFLASTRYGPIRVIATQERMVKILPGQRISITGTILATDERRVAAMVIATTPISALAPPSRWARWLDSMRVGLRTASGDGAAGALIPGMVIGDTSQQSDQLKNDMRRAGLTHLVAVSGANFAIVSAFVLWLMQFIFRTIPPRLIATAVALAAFIALVRPSPSVLRAAAMAAVMLIALASKQAKDSLPALGFAIATVIAIDPWQSRDPGFALSVLATAGLLLLAPPLTRSIERWLPEKLAAVVAIPIAALLLCLPVIVAISGYISLLSVIANIAAAPLVAPITIIGFIAAVISPLSPEIASLLVLLIRPLASVITSIAEWSARWPVLTLTQGLTGFIIALVIAALLISFKTRALIPIIATILALTWWGAFPKGDWDLYICDVGQGDGYVINLYEQRAIVIDVGPDPQLIDSCLRRLNIKTIALLILTHPHADHIAGLSGARHGREVEVEWFGNIAAGSRAEIGPYSIEVLWPLQVGLEDENPNNVSIAALIKSPDLTLFAAGDIEPPIQAQLRGKVGRVDIYKVAHHGSRFQDLPLMRELSPTVALISAGEGNSYGHPAPSTITALEHLHAKVLRTDRDGAIAIAAKRHHLTIAIEKGKFRPLTWD